MKIKLFHYRHFFLLSAFGDKIARVEVRKIEFSRFFLRLFYLGKNHVRFSYRKNSNRAHKSLHIAIFICKILPHYPITGLFCIDFVNCGSTTPANFSEFFLNKSVIDVAADAYCDVI